MTTTEAIKEVLSNGHRWTLAALTQALQAQGVITADAEDVAKGEVLTAVRKINKSNPGAVLVEGEDDSRTFRLAEPKIDGQPVRLVPISRIKADPEVQPRVDPIPAYLLQQYAEDIDQLKPVVVFGDPDKRGSELWLSSGFNRHQIYLDAGRTEIPVVCFPGGRDEAILYAVGRNSSREFGAVRTKNDMESAVLKLARHPVFGQWSVNRIAARADVSHGYAEKVISKWHAESGTAPSETVQTEDGRTMKRTYKGREPAPSANGIVHEPAPTPGTDPAVAVDLIGVPLTAHHGEDCGEVFASATAARDSIVRICKQLRETINTVAHSKAGDNYRDHLRAREVKQGDSVIGYRYVEPDVDTLEETLLGMLPHVCVCPQCFAADKIDPKCKACKGRNWVTKGAFDRSANEKREAVEALAS